MSRVQDFLGPKGVPGHPIQRIVEARHKLTALIESELYGAGGNKIEGRAALTARRFLDEFIFSTEQSDLARGRVEELAPLKCAIIPEKLSELVKILVRARASRGLSSGDIKAAMADIVDDPDRFDQFNPKEKATILKIAGGLSIFALRRFERPHEDIRRRGIPYMKQKPPVGTVSKGCYIDHDTRGVTR
jgi:hypothetical protein